MLQEQKNHENQNQNNKISSLLQFTNNLYNKVPITLHGVISRVCPLILVFDIFFQNTEKWNKRYFRPIIIGVLKTLYTKIQSFMRNHLLSFSLETVIFQWLFENQIFLNSIFLVKLFTCLEVTLLTSKLKEIISFLSFLSVFFLVKLQYFIIEENQISMSNPKKLLRINHSQITQSYRFIKEIGRGSSGICYLAQCRQKQSVCKCIKQIRKQSKTTPIPNEANFLDKLFHPNIIKLYQIFEDQKNYYLILDFCEGGDLFDFLEKQGIQSEAQSKKIFSQIISSIKYCHSLNISHRDLKPENFLLLKNPKDDEIPNVKLIDFDLSFQWKNNMESEILSQEGPRIKGTPYYISPQILKGKYDQRCDIWSAGVILYILLTGTPPFSGENQQQIFSQIKSGNLNFDSKIQNNSAPEGQQLSLLVKDLLKKILCPAQKRITMNGIFKHPWMNIECRKTKIQVDFTHVLRFLKFSKLKQIVAVYLASQMTAKETEVIENLFKLLDKNNDGYLSSDELKDGLLNLNMDQNVKYQMNNILKFIEGEEDLYINYNQFIAIFIKEKSIKSKNNLKKVFNMIDYDGNCFIDKQQLESILFKIGAKKKSLRQRALNKEADAIMATADKNNDGLIDFSEFEGAIMNQFQF